MIHRHEKIMLRSRPSWGPYLYFTLLIVGIISSGALVGTYASIYDSSQRWLMQFILLVSINNFANNSLCMLCNQSLSLDFRYPNLDVQRTECRFRSQCAARPTFGSVT